MANATGNQGSAVNAYSPQDVAGILGVAVKYFRGCMSFYDANGYANRPTNTPGEQLAGVLESSVDNTAGSTGLDVSGNVFYARVIRKGLFVFPQTGTAITLANRGQRVYAFDDHTITLAANNNWVGYVETVDSRGVIVRIDQASLAGNLFATQDTITAFAGGGQASATLLKGMINRVTIVATAADSVKLPSSAPGLRITVINAAANSMNVFPQTGESINALGANTAFAQAAGKTVDYYCVTAGQWYSLLSA